MANPFPDIAVPALHKIVAEHAAARPGASAIRYSGRVLDYAALDRLANRAAHSLLRDGLAAPGSRALFIGRNSDAVPVLALAANKAGIVPVPVNWRLAPLEIARIVTDCAPSVLFVEPDFLDVAREASHVSGQQPAILSARSLLGEDGWLASCVEPIDLQTDTEAIAVQVYTSGTTGYPKGVMLSHRALNGINSLRAQLAWDRWSEDDVTLIQAPLGHIGAFGMMARALYFGAEAVIHEGFDAGATLDAIAHNRVSKLALVPTAIKMILDLPQAGTTDYGALDTIIYGSAPITPSLLERAMATFQCRFAQSYGQSETTGPTVVLTPDDHAGKRLESVGTPLPATEVRISAEDGRILPPGVTGEIEIRSIANMSGYWNRPDETARTLTPDGWIRTGDAGYLDGEGYLFLRGRVKEMIISGAENVYPGEVEAVLAAHPDIADVAVVGIPDDHWGEAVTAVVVPRLDANLSDDVLRNWARERLAGYKVPKMFALVDALPLGATGKVDKSQLRSALLGHGSCKESSPT